MLPVQNNRALFNPNNVMHTRPSPLLTKVRVIATALFGTLLFICFKRRSDRYLIAGTTICLIVKHLYDQYVRKDSMMEAIYKIVGGNARFERLPSKEFSEGEPLLKQLNREEYTLPAYRMEIADGRKGVIFQGEEGEKPYVYIERLSAMDYWFEAIEGANFTVAKTVRNVRTGFRAKEFFIDLFSLSPENSIAEDYEEIRRGFVGAFRDDRVRTFSSISGDAANAFATQMQARN